MTSENRAEHVAREWRRGLEATVDFELLQERGRWAAAQGRAYYAMFYFARALLFSLGLEVRTHAGVGTLISEHLVRTGQFPAAQVRALRQMQRLREDADYETTPIFDEEAAREAALRLAAFQDSVRAYLVEQGYSLPE